MDRMETGPVMVGLDVSKAWLDVHMTGEKGIFGLPTMWGALPSWCGGSVAAAPFGW
jgi:hypothetical protein